MDREMTERKGRNMPAIATAASTSSPAASTSTSSPVSAVITTASAATIATAASTATSTHVSSLACVGGGLLYDETPQRELFLFFKPIS